MTTWLQEMGLAVLFIFGGWLLSRLSGAILRWLTSKLIGRTKTFLDDALVDAGRFPLQMGILVWGIDLGIEQISFIPLSWRPEINRVFFAIYAFLIFLFLLFFVLWRIIRTL